MLKAENIKIETEKAEFWKDNISQICELGHQKGYETIVVLQPFVGTGNKNLTKVEKIIFDRIEPALYSEYQLFADELKNLNTTCAGAFDLRNIFDDEKERIYFTQAHIGFKQNKQVADRLLELSLPTVRGN